MSESSPDAGEGLAMPGPAAEPKVCHKGKPDRERRGDAMNGPSFFRLLLVLPICLAMGSCARSEPAVPVPPAIIAENTAAAVPAKPAAVPDAWKPLLERLRQDGLAEEKMAPLFARMGDGPSQDPMGRKVQELYTGKFMRKTRVTPPKALPSNGTGIPGPWYKGFVTDANARRCRTFINTHAAWFREAEEKYGVPTEVAAALLFVETRLGDYLGEERALPILASMSVSRSPDAIPDWLDKLPGVENRLDWVGQRMADKADWAYAELKALLLYSLEAGIEPFDIPSSGYGAIGLCQFMPSNIALYGMDGDGDGVVDLFAPPDAVASLSHYLQRHGWKETMSVAEQIKVLRRYNNLGIYANTILALAAKIREIPGRPVAVKAAMPHLSAGQ